MNWKAAPRLTPGGQARDADIANHYAHCSRIDAALDADPAILKLDLDVACAGDADAANDACSVSGFATSRIAVATRWPVGRAQSAVADNAGAI